MLWGMDFSSSLISLNDGMLRGSIPRNQQLRASFAEGKCSAVLLGVENSGIGYPYMYALLYYENVT